MVAICRFARHLLDGISGKASWMCFYGGSAYNETEKVTGKCALVGTFGRWNRCGGRKNAATGISRGGAESSHLRKVCGKRRKMHTSEGGKGTVTGETLIQGALEAVPPPRTFGRWDENVGILHTFGRWKEDKVYDGR